MDSVKIISKKGDFSQQNSEKTLILPMLRFRVCSKKVFLQIEDGRYVKNVILKVKKDIEGEHQSMRRASSVYKRLSSKITYETRFY